MSTALAQPLSERLPDTSHLSSPLLALLRSLTQANRADADALREAGSATPAANLAAHLESMARRRCAFAATLEGFLIENEVETPAHGPSLLATLGLIWAHLKLALRGGDPTRVIDHVLAVGAELEGAYREALALLPGSPLNALFMEHLRQVRSDARTLKLLREALG